MGTLVVRGPKDCTTRTGPQAEATSIVGSQSRPCSGSGTSARLRLDVAVGPKTAHERAVAGREDSLATGRRECTDGARSRLPPAARQGDPGRSDAIVRGAAKVAGKVFRLP